MRDRVADDQGRRIAAMAGQDRRQAAFDFGKGSSQVASTNTPSRSTSGGFTSRPQQAPKSGQMRQAVRSVVEAVMAAR